MTRRAVSSTDVARLAGVSQSAVSRTFSAAGGVSAPTRRKVLDAAAALGYRPNRIPAIMQSGRSHMVGVVVGGLDNPFYAAVLDHFAVALRAMTAMPAGMTPCGGCCGPGGRRRGCCRRGCSAATT
ncbi:LacI family DNA-binding transcriptional regulator [Nguyenibacter sp. L1]|uniref:LacI family DNA-binding transcriptional regulator n=1 Tax=Nguyenibacter sp. L1 TaxID=3049350 RepID=UPI002B461A48|nr:LacI family DNA-binding transcriptional regulator [Nguyenibacter sp. L1]WRH88751.1 LacI family DNA-binding transcriptional regulator [Nguyenibacter sp. L1]